jgi:hypothetical protein
MKAHIMKHPDEGHLRALSICHYVFAGMSAFSGCIPLIHVTLGISMMAGAFDGGPNPPPPEFGLFFAVIGGAISLFSWTLAIFSFLGGRFLARHTHYRFCFVVAIIECLNMPMGTVLAVFTILVLSRDSVKALFAGIPYREPHQAMLDDMDADEPPPKTPAGPDDGSTRAGDPAP